MPYNGSGVFTRVENWTNDAASNLPISATKFDTEANDWASGFGLCLTRDGQGAPSSPLTWGQALTVNRGTDGGAVTAGRTGGSNNPALQLYVLDGTGGRLNLTTAQTLSLAIQGVDAVKVASTGAVSVVAATAAVSLSVAGAANQYSLSVTANSTSGQSYGIAVNAGTTSGDTAFTVRNQAISSNFFTIYGDGHGFLGPNVTNTLSWNTSGAFTFAAPTAGQTLNVAGLSNQYATNITAGSTSGQAFGLIVNAGSTSADAALFVRNQAASTNFMIIYGDGEHIITAPSAATNQSSTTFQLGYMDEPQNLQNATYQLVFTDRGKSIYHSSGSAHTWTIPANGTVAFPVGTIIRFINSGAGNVTINITTDTLTWYSSGTAGSGRVLSQFGACSIEKIASTSWVISGVGLS